jgi:ubiquinone biosynthesis protein UbiJ
VECVESKEDPLMQTVGTHQNNINSAMLQRARRLKTELQRGTRQIKNSIAEKIKEKWRGKRMYGELSRRRKAGG